MTAPKNLPQFARARTLAVAVLFFVLGSALLAQPAFTDGQQPALETAAQSSSTDSRIASGAAAQSSSAEAQPAPTAFTSPRFTTVPAEQPAIAGKPASEFPRTFKARFRDYRNETFTPWALFTPALGAGLSQWTDYPSEWKQGAEGYGKRVASNYGGVVIENTISLAVAAIDHEDLRYPRSTYSRNAIWKRTAHAISYTFVPREEGGGRRFGWARLIGAYGSGFVVNTWYPKNRSDVPNALFLGSMRLGGDLAINVLKEFIRPHVEFGNTH